MTQGKVFLVGAGPGDPGLVTLRAKDLIASADVVVYDFPVHPGLLAWCRPDCEKIFVDSRPDKTPAFQDVEELIVVRAKAGRNVVRLASGDPFVLGRGSEEARRLAADGIAFEVVPGVSAALAAGACTGIALTRRNTSPALVLLAVHEDPATHAPDTDVRRYGALPGATLAIQLGVAHLRPVLAGLIAGGLSPKAPAAVVQWASLGRQRSVTGTAATLADLGGSLQADAPTVLLIGDVVQDRETTNWFERLPLFGRRIVITRAREQAGDLRTRLERLGAEVLELPLVEIRPKAERDMILEIFEGIGQYDWLVFTSANGVRNFFALFLKAFRDLRGLGVMRIACVGASTARLVREMHLEVEICPESGAADGLADAMIATGSLDNAKVLVITGNLNRDTLVTKLEDERAIVDIFQVYENVRTDLAGHPAAEEFRKSGADAVLFASSSAVRAFAAQAGALQTAGGARRLLAGSIGPRTSEAMRETGIRVDFEAKESSIEALVDALVAKLGSSHD